MSPTKLSGHLFAMLGVLEGRLKFFVSNVLIPQAITKYVFRGPILGSWLLTIFAWAVTLLSLRVFYSIVLYPRYFSRFRHLPTPEHRSWLWGNFPPHFIEPMGMTLRTINETVPNDGMIRVYGFLSQERIFVTSTKAFAEILVQKGYEFTKTFQLRYNAARIIGHGLACSEGDAHRQQRKNLLPAFSFRHIKELHQPFWKKSCELVQCLDKEITGPDGKPTHKVISMKQWASHVTLDIIGVTGMDYDFKSLQEPDNELVRIYGKLLAPPPKNFRYFASIGNFLDPRVIARLPFKFNKMIKKNSDVVRKVTGDIIDKGRQRLAEGKDSNRVDIVGQMLKGGAFKDDELIDHMMSILAAGHETTSVSFQWMLVTLCRQPEIQERLRKEVRGALPASCFPSPDDPTLAGLTLPTAEMVDDLSYTKAVTNEVLRCFPAAPQNIRVSEDADSYVQGEFIPKGTRLLIAPQAVNHDPKLWGPDAAEFNPDRWMAPGQSTSGGAGSAYAQMTFLHGPHGCIGKDFSRSELNVLSAVFVGCFRFELEDPEKEVGWTQGVTVSPAGGTRLRLERVK